MSHFDPQHWRGFLPARSILMGRRSVEASSTVQVSENTQESLELVQADLENCRRCKLCNHRNHIVFGEGNPQARLMFVGQGPEEDEDQQGRPFVGKAGQLLDKMIQAMGLRREDVYITTVIKCRPPENRSPEPDEIAQCTPFILRQIACIQPEVIVALGKFASQILLQTEMGITQLRGQFRAYPGDGKTQVMPTFHPSYLLKNAEAKREVWSDLQQVSKILGITVPNRK